MPKSTIARIIEILFKIILICGIICLPFIPKLYGLVKIFDTSSFSNQTIYYRIMFYVCYIVCLCIIFTLNYIFKKIYISSPFNKTIEKSLKIIAVLFMLLSLIILIKTVFIPTIFSIGVVIVSFIQVYVFIL